MNQCEKITLLMYKEIDLEISEKEKQKLNKHISSCEKCRSEYEFIKTLSMELQNAKEVSLPENFHRVLREKLVAQNLNRNEKVSFYKRIPVHYAITACLAILITVYAFGNQFNSHKLIDQSPNEPNMNQAVVSESSIPKETNQSVTEMQKETKAPAKTITPNQTQNEKKTENTPHVSIAPTESQDMKQTAPGEASARQIEVPMQTDSALKEEIIEETLVPESDTNRINNNIEENTQMSIAGSGGSSATIALKSAKEEILITITVKGKLDLSQIQGVETIGERTFKVPITQYDAVMSMLSDLEYEITNDEEDTKKKESFIIITE